MMNHSGLRRIPPDQSSGSALTFGSPRHRSVKDPILSKRVCFYKSGDPQFNGLRMVINNRTFKTFDALLDSLSNKVPLPFGVRNITTPRGSHAIYTLDDLEDGKSYICSDNHKVKPINLALARKKLPPWYHARPVSSRRRTVQQGRFFPGQNMNKQERVVVRTPKRLLVFRNGYPSVKHTVVLHKRNTPTFESILEYISDLMQFHVVKLHTPDGRRVDSLPGLIMCSGTVVAAGREPFRSANYNAQKLSAPAWIPPSKMTFRRLKPLNRKKYMKATSYSLKSRNFSPSSERYIINRIQNSIAESSFDLPNSAEVESNRVLESVAETEDEGAEAQGCVLPAEDDIEKSFRVNQDGSMTVEMKVRLTIKEEETIHWTTTLTRSSVANQLSTSCLPAPEAEQEICSPQSYSLDLQSSPASIDSINKDTHKDNNDEDPPSLSNGAVSESDYEEVDSQVQTVASPRGPHTSGHKQIRQIKTSVENIASLMTEGIQEGMVGSYSYKEQTDHGAMTEQYCMVKQSTSRPVPKPRRFGSMDASNVSSRNVSTFKSAGMTEILQIDSGEEVTETFLHIYEQQTCQDNFFANIHTKSMASSGGLFVRPATSETGPFSSNTEFEPELWRPSTASESINIWRTENMSVASTLTSPSPKTGAIQTTKGQQQLAKLNRGKEKPQQREVTKAKRVYSRPNMMNKHGRRLLSPGKRQKENPAKATDMSKDVKTFSSAGFIRGIYGNKSKSAKNTMKGATQKRASSVTTNGSQRSDDATSTPRDPTTSSLTDNSGSFETNRLNVSSTEVSQSRGMLTRQTSMHQEKKNENTTDDISKRMELPAFNSSSSVTNKYVENWLERAHIKTTPHPDEESKKADIHLQKDSENNGESESLVRSSVKLRIQCFEKKSSNSPAETKQGEIAPCHGTTINRENCSSEAQNNTQEITPTLSGVCSEINPMNQKSTTEMQSGITVENKSSAIKISLQRATPSETNSMELPPPPSPAELIEQSNTEYCVTDDSSAASSPLYRLSSESSQMSDDHLLSISSTSDKTITPTGNAMEMTPSVQTDIPTVPREAPLQRAPSIKRAPLVSNVSLERKMSLRKASLDKYTLSTDASSDTSTSPTPINTVGIDDKILPNAICSIGMKLPPEKKQQSSSILDVKSIPSCCTSVSPASLTSGERLPSDSISSCETPTSSDASFKETMPNKTARVAQKEASSPQQLVKKVKIMSSPSPERKPQKKFSSEHANASPKPSSLHDHRSDKTPTASPTTEKKKALNKPNIQKKLSPYSQSLDMVSPPVRHKSNRRTLSRNLSSENSSEPLNKTQRKTTDERKHHKTAEQNKMVEANRIYRNTETQFMPQPLNIANQPNMKPVLEKICYSIKSIRQITQNKRRSCLEKSNSVPDFSSHVASTFGSSSKALLAFLSVMTLKEGINNHKMDELISNNVSCAEALKMIDSLREIASIEDSHKLKTSLSNLQKSASKQLLQSWKDFQDLGNKCKNHSTTPNCSEEEFTPASSPESDRGISENVIDEIMENLDMPDKLKAELASLSMGDKTESDDEENTSGKVEMSPKYDSDSKISRYSTDTGTDMKHDQTTEDEDSQYGQSGTTEPEEEDKETMSSYDEENQESNQKMLNMNVSIEKSLEKHSPGLEYGQPQSEESVGFSENEFKSDDHSGSVEEGQSISSANKDAEQRDSCMESVSGSESGLQRSSDEFEEIKQKGSDDDNNVSNTHSSSEEEEDKKQSSNYYVELSVSRKERICNSDSENKSLTEEEKPDNIKSCMGLNISESTGTSDAEAQASSEEEKAEAECTELKMIVEETLSETEEEQEIIEGHLDDQQEEMGNTLIEETEEDKVNSDNDESHSDKEHIFDTKGQDSVGRGLNSLMIEDQDAKSDSLTQRYRCSADEDSGNDHSSCEEQVEMEQPKVVEEQTSNSIKQELSYYEKESSSEVEQGKIERYAGESCKEYEEVTNSKKVKHQPVEVTSQFIAERLSLLEKQAADGQRRENITNVSGHRQESDVEDSPSESPTCQSTLCTQSTPQSSLSFSYDSSGVITTEPEGSRVKSIREMFLAKSATEMQHGQKSFPTKKRSELPRLRAETSVSGGYQSQTSSELSSGEDDSARKSITKGFVRRAIERLYGKKNNNTDEEAGERPPSASKENHSNIFSPFHITQSKTVSELSYFNSNNTLDTLSEATRCIAFNAQVGPGDSVPIDSGRWLLRENTVIRKSISDPVGINKAFTNPPPGEKQCEDTEQSNTYSLFTTKSEVEEKTKSFIRKCTYFSLPHASDSDACQDDLSTASKGSMNGDSVTDTKDSTEDTKPWAERNGTLPSVITDLKMMDNKVHPLVEAPSDGEVVLAQPRKGQGAMNRRMQEPDVLDFLYNFCGQHCPIL